MFFYDIADTRVDGYGRPFVTNRVNGKLFLVDTGATKTTVCATAEERKLPVVGYFQAFNGTRMKIFGKRMVDFDIGLGRIFSFPAHIVETEQFGLLGADFLKEFGISVDVKNLKLIQRVQVFFVVSYRLNTQTDS